MATISEALAIAVQQHQAGQLQAAERIYRQILADDPEQVDALHLLGVSALQQGKADLAAQYIRRAIQLNATEPAFHCSLGDVFRASGKLDDAIGSYRRALELKPEYADAWSKLGVAFQDQGKLEDAVACFQRALAVYPGFVFARYNLAGAHKALGRFDEAISSYLQTLELKPDLFEAHNNLGTVYQDQGKLPEAVGSFQRAIELNPNLAEAHSNLGAAFQAQGKLVEAVAAYGQALKLRPDDAVACNNMGAALLGQGKLDEAAGHLRRALELRPTYTEAHNNLGTVLKDKGMLNEAIESYRRALELKPDYAMGHYNLGIALQDQGKLEEAVTSYLRARELDPGDAEVHNNLGSAFEVLGKLDAAIASYRLALELKPDLAEAHCNHAMLMLQRGDFERGWPEYEWRVKRKDFSGPALRRSSWDGSPVGGRGTILLHSEQGLGDTLQFVRYAALVKQRAGQVFLRCSKKLIPLLSRCRGIDQLVPSDAERPVCDAEAYLTSLPLALNTTLETVPRDVPYLFADPLLVEQWRARLPAAGFRVGIAWQGNPEFKLDKSRSIPLMEFAPLAQIEGVRLISLQKVHGIEQLAVANKHFSVTELGPGLDESSGTFMDTAAVMMNLDLVITSDTAIAHLAGGLGVRVWAMLSHTAEWRWLLDRSDSPWYPTMRLFRQKARDVWGDVFDEIRTALRAGV